MCKENRSNQRGNLLAHLSKAHFKMILGESICISGTDTAPRRRRAWPSVDYLFCFLFVNYHTLLGNIVELWPNSRIAIQIFHSLWLFANNRQFRLSNLFKSWGRRDGFMSFFCAKVNTINHKCEHHSPIALSMATYATLLACSFCNSYLPTLYLLNTCAKAILLLSADTTGLLYTKRPNNLHEDFASTAIKSLICLWYWNPRVQLHIK